jgi:hypothetical protein
MATFVTTAGDRIQGIEFPPELAGPSISQQQRQRWLQDQGLVNAAGQKVEQPAADDQEDDSDQVDMASSAEAVTALASIAGRVDAIASQVEQFSTAEQLGSLQLELQRWSAQAGRVALAHQELAALCDQTIAACEAVGRRVQEHLAQLEANQAAAQAELQAAAAEVRTIAQAAASDLDRRMAAVEALAPTLVGDKGDQGDQGIPGPGSTLVDADPMATDPESFGRKFYGRGLVPGDSCLYLNSAANAVVAYRFASNGSGWEKGLELVPRTELVNANVSSLSTGNTVFSAGGGADGGGGMGIDEHLTTNRVPPGAAVVVADASNWANLPEVEQVTSGVLDITLKPLNGGLMGRTLLVNVPFTWESGGGQFMVDGDLGSLSTFADVSITVQRGAATAAPGYMGAMPNKTVSRVFLMITPKVGGGGFGTTTMFRVSGDIAWNFEAAGVAIPAGQPLPQPLWWWT